MKRASSLEPSDSNRAAEERSNDCPRPLLGIINSREVFGDRRELLIEHDGSLYRLRITQNNKLILTK